MIVYDIFLISLSAFLLCLSFLSVYVGLYFRIKVKVDNADMVRKTAKIERSRRDNVDFEEQMLHGK